MDLISMRYLTLCNEGVHQLKINATFRIISNGVIKKYNEYCKKNHQLPPMLMMEVMKLVLSVCKSAIMTKGMVAAFSTTLTPGPSM